MKKWIDYYNERARYISDPIEIAEMSMSRQQYNMDIQRIITYLSLPSDKTLIDLGCCTGNSIKMVKPFVKSVIGVDMAVNALSCAKLRHPDCQFIKDNVTKLKSFNNRSYSLFLCFGLLHYLNDKEINIFFSTLSRVIKPNGIICFIRVPNSIHYESYQAYRINNKKDNNELKWNWISEDIISNLAKKYGLLYKRKKQFDQLEMPMKAFFDFVLKYNSYDNE